ncbi:MAG: restriction endonuclease [Nanoarchaeota archaeon]|nr:restriction endonuclease [Nanoarchaeota archaeon]MBU4452312.1 restriction endonuclease [Nanoarchaeota archaeon]MCG2723838.1 restriction endonuclease [archaeon]
MVNKSNSFTEKIIAILKEDFGEAYEDIFDKSLLIQYLNIKTRSAHSGSKSRSSFANIYVIYVLVEDYLKNDFHKNGGYKDYEGAIFTDLFRRQRELPFGQKLQNHAFNNRLNGEFKKYFPAAKYPPIISDVTTRRYWFNEKLLIVSSGKEKINIAETVIKIIDNYMAAKQSSFESFIKSCEEIIQLEGAENGKAIIFIKGLLAPNVDARLFEIASYSILKYYYHDQIIYFGFNLSNLKKQNLVLYKTGRTNANDGGIDFVMKPLGRFFQVTETTDVHKFLLDIDKIERYPITFVIKSESKVDVLLQKMEENAEEIYSVKAIVKKYMDCIEEVVNIPKLMDCLDIAIKNGYLKSIIHEIMIQSKVEFNLIDAEDLEKSDKKTY